jgi:hypothetical protein
MKRRDRENNKQKTLSLLLREKGKITPCFVFVWHAAAERKGIEPSPQMR